MQETGFHFESALGNSDSSLETYLQRMSTEGTWGDGLILSAASLLYNCPIYIHYVSQTEPVKCIALCDQSVSHCEMLQMHLGFLDDNHYVSLERIEAVDEPLTDTFKPLSPTVLTEVSLEVPEIVQTEPEGIDIILDQTEPQESPNIDIGAFATREPAHIPTAVRLKLLKDPWIPPKNYPFPLSVKGKRTHKFNICWLDQFRWLAYSKTMEGAYCTHCVMFANRHPSSGSLGSLVVNPQKRYKDALSDFRAHENCEYHKEAAEKVDAFLNAIRTGTTVVQLSDAALATRMSRNSKVLASVVESVIFCGRQNIALRGHRVDGEIVCSDTGRSLTSEHC